MNFTSQKTGVGRGSLAKEGVQPRRSSLLAGTKYSSTTRNSNPTIRNRDQLNTASLPQANPNYSKPMLGKKDSSNSSSSSSSGGSSSSSNSNGYSNNGPSSSGSRNNNNSKSSSRSSRIRDRTAMDLLPLNARMRYLLSSRAEWVDLGEYRYRLRYITCLLLFCCVVLCFPCEYFLLLSNFLRLSSPPSLRTQPYVMLLTYR